MGGSLLAPTGARSMVSPVRLLRRPPAQEPVCVCGAKGVCNVKVVVCVCGLHVCKCHVQCVCVLHVEMSEFCLR